MSAPAAQPLDPRVIGAVDVIVEAMGLKPAQRKELTEYLAQINAAFPKLPHVSFFMATTRRGGQQCRLKYRIKGFPLRVERLGKVPRVAYQRARRVSEVLVQVKNKLMEPKEAHRILYVDHTPIGRHVETFHKELAAKGNKPRYVRTLMTRLQRCVELAEYERINDITRDSLVGLTATLKTYIEPEKKKPLTAKTINDYLAALRQFTRWATPKLLTADPLVNTGGIKGGKTKPRRDILLEEVEAIVATARANAGRFKWKGDDRAMYYLAAWSTGLRANELRQLQIAWLRLDAEKPHIAVPAEITKTGVEAKQPLPEWFVPQLRAWLGDRKTGRVWKYVPRDVIDVFDRDRETARQLWVDAAPSPAERERREKSEFLARTTGDGELVFHSHRHGFSTQVLKNLDLKTAQRLTRHETTAMLTERYGHSRFEHAAEGVQKSIQNPVKGAPQGAPETA